MQEYPYMVHESRSVVLTLYNPNREKSVATRYQNLPDCNSIFLVFS